MIKNKKKKREIDNYTPNTRGFVPSTVTNKSRYGFTEVKKPYDRTPRDMGFNAVKNTHAFNATMLRLAYEQPNKVVTAGDKMFVSGTDPTNPRDVWDDVSKIPNYKEIDLSGKLSGAVGAKVGEAAGTYATGYTGNPIAGAFVGTKAGEKASELTKYMTKDLGDSTKIHRYGQAKEELEKQGDKVKHLVGHSMGGNVALEMQKEKPHLKSTTYGAAVWQPFSTEQGDRYRHGGDPISMFDRGAKTIGGSWNPVSAHAFTGYPEGTYASNTADVKDGDSNVDVLVK